MNVVGIIPARFKSTRFPGKPLADILGKSMIHRVYAQCKKCSLLNDIIVATDDKRIFNHVEEFGGKVMMSADYHKTGTERCGEIAKSLTNDYDIIVNIQGDEPYINPKEITQVISLFNDKKTEIATLAKKISKNKSIEDRNHVKILFNKDDIATNFFRSIPANYSTAPFYKHIGIYAYTKNTLLKILAYIKL